MTKLIHTLHKSMRASMQVEQAEKMVYVKANLGHQEKQSDAAKVQMDALG